MEHASKRRAVWPGILFMDRKATVLIHVRLMRMGKAQVRYKKDTIIITGPESCVQRRGRSLIRIAGCEVTSRHAQNLAEE